MVKRIGRHSVTNASIEDPVLDSMLAGQKIDILYSDPPWGDGNMKYWVTMNKKMTGAEFRPLSYQQLIDRLFQLVDRYVSGYIFIETGLRWGDAIKKDMAKHGMFNIKEFMLQYRSGSKMIDMAMVCCGTRPKFNFPMESRDGLYEFYGQDLPRKVIGMIPGMNILDPCCGMGYTAQAAVDKGANFFGNEFNAKRLSKTIARLEKDAAKK